MRPRRAPLLGALPTAALLGRLGLGQVAAVAPGVGTFNALSSIAYAAYLPRRVERAELPMATARLAFSTVLGRTGGPALAGLLVEVIGAPLALVADALACVASGTCVGAIRADEPPPPAGSPAESVVWRVVVQPGVQVGGARGAANRQGGGKRADGESR